MCPSIFFFIQKETINWRLMIIERFSELWQMYMMLRTVYRNPMNMSEKYIGGDV